MIATFRIFQLSHSPARSKGMEPSLISVLGTCTSERSVTMIRAAKLKIAVRSRMFGRNGPIRGSRIMSRDKYLYRVRTLMGFLNQP